MRLRHDRPWCIRAGAHCHDTRDPLERKFKLRLAISPMRVLLRSLGAVEEDFQSHDYWEHLNEVFRMIPHCVTMGQAVRFVRTRNLPSQLLHTTTDYID